MKRIFFALRFVTLTASAFAQDTTDTSDVPEIGSLQRNDGYKQYKPKHYFVGVNLVAGFGDGGGAFGINPSIGTPSANMWMSALR